MLYSSYVRSETLRASLGSAKEAHLPSNQAPAEGDLAIVTATGQTGAYTSVETPEGEDVPLLPGTSFVGVLGTRRSGVNVQGRLPDRPVGRGDQLWIISAAGLLGVLEYVPQYLGGTALSVRVDGFPSWNGRPANLLDALPEAISDGRTAAAPPTVVVAGTSAECGKTTCMEGLIRAALARDDGTGVAAVKATGTGRLRDVNRYRRAGATDVRDFVDLGLCTTYNTAKALFQQVFERLLVPTTNVSVMLVELGGDLLEARVPDAVGAVAGDAPLVLCVNDALGAMAGRALLASWGVTRIEVATMHANPAALADRLRIPEVVDLYDPTSLEQLFHRLMHVPDGD